MKIRFPDNGEAIDAYLTDCYLDASLADALIAEYCSAVRLAGNTMPAAIVGSVIQRKSHASLFHRETTEEILRKVFGVDMDGLDTRCINKQFIVNRVKEELKKYYLVRRLKYKYDSLRRALSLHFR